jgi:hypothetical protein
MADKPHVSIKQTKIDKAYTAMLVTISLASFVTVFSLISSKVLLNQYSYQNRIIAAKQVAVNQLKSDAVSGNSLISNYKKFVNSSPINILGSNVSGNAQNNGNNAKIVLDALPGQYDFPGLVTSLDNLLSNQAFTLTSISGTDQELAEQHNSSSTSPVPVEIPLSISATGSYTSIQQLFSILQLSIRPIVVQSINLSGTDTTLTANISGYTFYQPAKVFSIGTEIVK